MSVATKTPPNQGSLPDAGELEVLGKDIYELITRMYPICRSITGDGFRETLKIIQEYIPLQVHEVPTGTAVFDWDVPKEWNIRDAYIKNPQGEKIVDFQECNLHVVNYSIPVHKKVTLAELKEHLYSIPEYPDWIPYRTSYYKENWGFCLPHQQYLALEEGEYEVYIDSSLEPGHLSYGEYYLEGESQEEVLISCHGCHPSLCNDNLSGIGVAVFLAQYLSQLPQRKYSYRFIFIPATIGAVTWLWANEEQVERIKHGLVLTCVGDSGKFTYKKSRRGNADIDKIMGYVLQESGSGYEIIDFFPYGYDERQFCSPGFNLAVGCFMRSPHGSFPEYHTSADNLDFVKPEYLASSLSQCLSAIHILENNCTYVSQNPKCEPRLGKRGLYRSVGGQSDEPLNELALLWVLNLADGSHSLLDMAVKSKLSFGEIKKAADILAKHDLLKKPLQI